MPGNNLLSVCCLGYKHATFITDCITTIWQDPWPEKEILAMDDGSRDGSTEILKNLANESPCPFTVLEQKNTGNIPANFNKLLNLSRGDYVLFTSLDDMQIPGALEARMERLLPDDNCVFAAHTMCFVMEGKTLKPEITPLDALADPACDSLADRSLELERTLFHSFYIQGGIFRKSMVQAVNGFSENMIGDDIVLRTKIFFHLLAHPELSFSLIREPGFIYRRHAQNVSQNVMRQLELAFQYYDKFWRDKPYPEMMKQWLLTGLDVEPYEKIIRAFGFSDRASSFLFDKDIQDALRISAVKSYVKDQRFQYLKRTGEDVG